MSLLRVVFLFGIAGLMPAATPADEFPFLRPVQPPRRVQVMAHRGAHDAAPENTAAAIEESIADSVDWVEIDVRLARDGRHVVIHDATLERTTDGAGRVADHAAAFLKGLDAGVKFSRRHVGEKVPTLAEVLAVAKDRVNLYLDCKEIDPAQLARDIAYAGMERQVVVVAKRDVLRAVRSAPGGERLALMPKWKAADGLTSFYEDLRPAAVEIQAGDATAEACRAFHARGLKILAVALKDNDRTEVWDRVIDAGADWVQTDRAEELLARESLKRLTSERVKVAHHRQASRYAPENTIPALEKSIRLGADLIDFDVCTSRDGVPVLMHDASLDRTTNARGPVRQRDAAELGRLDAGKWFGSPYIGTSVPTLDSFLQAAGDQVELYLDAKDIAPEAIVAALRSHNRIERTVVHASVDDLVRLRTLEPRLRRVPNLLRRSDLDDLIDRVQPYAIDAHLGVLTREVIDRCHARGVKVFTVTHAAEESVPTYLRAIGDGVEVIQTDHPVRVLRALELGRAPKN